MLVTMELLSGVQITESIDAVHDAIVCSYDEPKASPNPLYAHICVRATECHCRETIRHQRSSHVGNQHSPSSQKESECCRPEKLACYNVMYASRENGMLGANIKGLRVKLQTQCLHP